MKVTIIKGPHIDEAIQKCYQILAKHEKCRLLWKQVKLKRSSGRTKARQNGETDVLYSLPTNFYTITVKKIGGQVWIERKLHIQQKILV